MPAHTAKKNQLVPLRSESLKSLSWLIHAFSTRAGGFSKAYGKSDLNLGFTKDDSRAAVGRNRKSFLEALKAENFPLLTLRQIHSDLIHKVDSAPEHQLVGDGLLTATPGLLLAIQTADCLPVILADARRHAIGVFHAGWRGTVKRIVQKGVGEMHRYFGSRSTDLKAAIGPGVHNCCYQVGEEVRDQFHSQFAYADKLFHETKESDDIHERYPLLFLTARAPGHSELPTKIWLNLVEANRHQLLDAGVPAKNISTSELCTSCRTDLLFSYRAEKAKTGRLMAVAAIRK